MNTVRNKESGKYGMSFDSTDTFADLYVDLLFTTKSSKGRYDAPHLKLIIDMMNSIKDEDRQTDLAVIMYITEEGYGVERFSLEDFKKDFDIVDEKSGDEWEEIFQTEYKVKKWYHGNTSMDLLDFWLSYFWDKRGLSNDK